LDLNILQFRELLIDELLQDKVIDREEDQEEKADKKNIHFLEKFSKSPRAYRKRCQECYKRLSKKRGRDCATLKARKVVTFCRQYENMPPMCLKCFKKVHKNK
jgi:hypothetical protein